MLIWEKIGHPRTLLERTGLSDSKIILIANASCSYHILWQCTLSERPLWLLVLPVAKQFTVPVLGYRVSNGSLPVIREGGKGNRSSQVGWQSCLLTAKSKACCYWMAPKRVSTFQWDWLVCSRPMRSACLLTYIY